LRLYGMGLHMSRRQRQPAYMPDNLADVFAQMERERKQKERRNESPR
jgi:hypothetical protein